MFFFWDSTMLLLIPVLLLSLYAQFKVKATFKKYSKIPSAWGKSGVTVAQEIMQQNLLFDLEIEEGKGNLTDFYDPRSKKVVLSPENYRGNSIASLSVTAHEIGHALQDKSGYNPLQWRHTILPVANLGSRLAFPLFIIGLIFSQLEQLMNVGIILFAGVVVFQLITLPVEFNASARAIKILKNGGYLTPNEIPMARQVLNAAALTYVAATAVAVVHLLRMVILSGSRD